MFYFFMLWIWFTLLAGVMQACRNALQKQLSLNVPTLGVTLARFIFASPLALLYLCWHAHISSQSIIPDFNALFMMYVLLASLTQILATSIMVQLFRLKNYAVGAGLAKSEAILSAILGVLFFATPISLLGWIGILIGSIAIFLMTGINNTKDFSWKTLLLGLASGLGFALTSLWVREASLTLNLPALVSASWVLFCVLTLQAICLTLFLWVKQKQTLIQLWQYKKLTIATSMFSFLGSLGWFSAMSLQHVAFVKTVGQVEVIVMLMISYFIFKEHLKYQDLIGLFLIIIASILVIWS